MSNSKYRLLLIQAFCLPSESPYIVHESLHHMPKEVPKESRLMDYENVAHLLNEVEWDFRAGPVATYGDWPVETREEFALVAAGRLPLVREACESGKYNGIVLLGGGEPGFVESREIGRRFGVPVTANAFSQMHIATMLGNKFSIIDLSEQHNMFYYDLVIRHRFENRCASIRNIDFPLPRPPHVDKYSGRVERAKALRGEQSDMVDAAVREAILAIEEDGAEVITLGCSATFWLRPFLEKRLNEEGWDVPVLDGYSASIALVKLMIDLGVDASGLMFPDDRPRRSRRKKTF
jgi:Asp/Glu/hydantoin racemase